MRLGLIKASWRRWTILVLAGFGVFHFALAFRFWLMLLRDFWAWPGRTGMQVFGYLITHMGPSVGLLVAFAIALSLAVKRRRAAIVWLIVATLVSVGAMGYDVSNHRYQIQALTTHGCDHFYCTWWWLDDRCLERFGFER